MVRPETERLFAGIQEVVSMYEAQFHFKRRPFGTTPDPRCFLASGSIEGALDELVVCVEQGQGVAVVSAPAGTGKTLLCERLRSELEEHFEVVFLGHATFLTRRALLQTILADLNHVYRRHDEQELRLELIPAIRALNPKKQALVLICDEAHMLTEDLLEELRILSDLAERGTPLVRLVLVGQPALEETLTRQSLEALNQRIRAHVCLEPFDRAASLDYIDFRITWAGGRTVEVFTPEALELICHASQGVARCINQLCDHTLLLAYVAEQAPVRVETVREALKDLRQLPLHWNESLTDSSSLTQEEQSAGAEDEPQFEDTGHYESVEFGADSAEPVEHADESTLDQILSPVSDFHLTGSSPIAAFPHAESIEFDANELPPIKHSPEYFVEEIVWDRYAAIDGGFATPEGIEPSVQTSEWGFGSSHPAESPDLSDTLATQEVQESATEPVPMIESESIGESSDGFETVCARLDEMLPAIPQSQSWDSAEVRFDSDQTGQVEPSQEEDIGQSVRELMEEIRDELGGSTSVPDVCEQLQALVENPVATVVEVGATTVEHVGPADSVAEADRSIETRPYRNLFSQLRRKQQGLL